MALLDSRDKSIFKSLLLDEDTLEISNSTTWTRNYGKQGEEMENRIFKLKNEIGYTAVDQGEFSCLYAH